MSASGGQTLNDRILSARHSLAGQGLAKAVCKATTEELIGPKRKHLEYLLRCTEEPNVSIPTLANLLLERTQSPNWIVVFKSLVSIHHLMCFGNERFTQYLASSNTNFQLSSFLDKSGVHGYDMSPFVRRYAKYLREKSVAYRAVAFDFCKIKRGKDGGTLRQMSSEKLLKTLPILHEQLDALIEFEATAQDLNNGVINAAFVLLFKDLIRLFACYNDGIINLLEKYFDMNKKHAREALDIYKKFLIRMDRVAEFLKVAENIGMDKSDIPNLVQAPSSLLEALDAHLASLEGRKPGSIATTPTGATAAGRVNVAAAVTVLSSTSSAFGSSHIDEKLQKQLLAEEEQAMAKYKDQHRATNPFSSSAPVAEESSSEPPNILDLFGMSGSAAPSTAAVAPTKKEANKPSASTKASDDLLQLSGNPFASSVLTASSSNNQTYNNSPFATGFQESNANGAFGMTNVNPYSYPQHQHQSPVMSPNFGVDNSFKVFGASSNNNPNAVGANFFGDILQPQSGGNSSNGHSMGGTSTTEAAKLVGKDLDSSIANLTSNLNLASGSGKNSAMSNRPKGPPMAAAAASSKPF